MKLLILILIGIVLLLFPITSALIVDLPYTDNYEVYSLNLTENTIINIPSGNIIDSIEYKPKYLPISHEIMSINTSYILNDHEYKNVYNLETKGAILKIYSTKLEYDINHYIDDELNHQKKYEAFLYSYCWFTTCIKEYYGSQSDITDGQILIHSQITTATGINRKDDIFNVYNSKSYVCMNYSIELNNLDNVDCIITYKLEGMQTKDYYIGSLSPTLKVMYEMGFVWIDKDLYILNLFMITTYIMNMLFFWIQVLAVGFIPIMFAVLFFIIPFLALYNARNSKQFIDNLVNNYIKLFNIVIIFLNFVINIGIKFVEICRSLIPFI